VQSQRLYVLRQFGRRKPRLTFGCAAFLALALETSNGIPAFDNTELDGTKDAPSGGFFILRLNPVHTGEIRAITT
jgi:hypothetical protein